LIFVSDVPKKRLLIGASGTGGHIFPALAVAYELSEFEIHWLGVPDRLENKLVPKAYPLHIVELQGLNRKPSIQWLKSAGQLTSASQYTNKLLRSGKFSAAFTTGGYIAAPLVIAARLAGVPAIGHESNVLPGKVMRTLAGSMRAIGLGFAESADAFSGAATRWVGTPVRPEFLRQPTAPLLDFAIPEQDKLIVALGGSQGARGLNQLMVEASAQWLAQGHWVIHLCGQGEYEAVRAKAPNHPHYFCLPFWEQMDALLGRADLAISRSGAGTLAELLITGTPAILVPFPFAAEDHQRINGEVLVKAGAAVQFDQATLSAEILERTVSTMLADEILLRSMAQKARGLAKPDAAKLTANLIREVCATVS
jgi:UDP-N-acetylglucosamine--N-acetylmuramyl-(pentapeptide) pyrophosphoryl-undecaprenol N-acetylglucosamine transferase